MNLFKYAKRYSVCLHCTTAPENVYLVSHGHSAENSARKNKKKVFSALRADYELNAWKRLTFTPSKARCNFHWFSSICEVRAETSENEHKIDILQKKDSNGDKNMP